MTRGLVLLPYRSGQEAVWRCGSGCDGNGVKFIGLPLPVRYLKLKRAPALPEMS